MKEKPQRTCIACRKEKDKSDLIRIVKSADGEIVLDKSGKKAGRGAYICASLECITKCVKSKALNRSFKMQISDEVYETLRREYLNEQ